MRADGGGIAGAKGCGAGGSDATLRGAIGVESQYAEHIDGIGVKRFVLQRFVTETGGFSLIPRAVRNGSPRVQFRRLGCG